MRTGTFRPVSAAADPTPTMADRLALVPDADGGHQPGHTHLSSRDACERGHVFGGLIVLYFTIGETLRMFMAGFMAWLARG